MKKYIIHVLFWIGAVYPLLIINIITTPDVRDDSIEILLYGIPIVLVGTISTIWANVVFERKRRRALNTSPFKEFQLFDGFDIHEKSIVGCIEGYALDITYELDIGPMQRVIKYRVFYDIGSKYESTIMDEIETYQYRYSKKYKWYTNAVEVGIVLNIKKLGYEELKARITETIAILKLEVLKPLELN